MIAPRAPQENNWCNDQDSVQQEVLLIQPPTKIKLIHLIHKKSKLSQNYHQNVLSELVERQSHETLSQDVRRLNAGDGERYVVLWHITDI